MKEIPLSKKGKHSGKYCAIVDDEDYEELNKHSWHLVTCKRGSKYAGRWIVVDKKRVCILMHRIILGLNDKKLLGDHEDGNSLNNQRKNLRSATYTQNNTNTKSRQNSTSKYLGVCKYSPQWENKNGVIKKRFYWRSSITYNNKQRLIGSYPFTPCGELLAALEYDIAAEKHYGKFSKLNFAQNFSA